MCEVGKIFSNLKFDYPSLSEIDIKANELSSPKNSTTCRVESAHLRIVLNVGHHQASVFPVLYSYTVRNYKLITSQKYYR